jgi:hypothetical protein
VIQRWVLRGLKVLSANGTAVNTKVLHALACVDWISMGISWVIPVLTVDNRGPQQRGVVATTIKFVALAWCTDTPGCIGFDVHPVTAIGSALLTHEVCPRRLGWLPEPVGLPHMA